MSLRIRGGNVLLEGGAFVETDLILADGRIAAIGGGAADSEFDARGLLVLPGIVDLHGDAFERQLMPRPGVHFPADMALLDTDRQLLANGITTAFHGLTWSWEPGLRGREAAFALMDALDGLRDRLSCETRIHLRHEIYNLAAEPTILDWIARGRISVLAFNDHLPDILAKRAPLSGLRPFADRAGLSLEAFADLLDAVGQREGEVTASVERLAAAARHAGIALVSHDDSTPKVRNYYHDLGCRLCEFPLNHETAWVGRALGDWIIMGSPNVMRGGSHAGGLAAATAIRQGLCDILTSDYYYPALLHAPFRLAADGSCGLGDAWALVSRNPARAAGLSDRGEIAVGHRADLLLVEAGDLALPRLHATLVGGNPVYAGPGRPLNGRPSRQPASGSGDFAGLPGNRDLIAFDFALAQ